jgi:hypothetical protein
MAEIVEWERDGELLGLAAKGYTILAVVGTGATAAVAGGLTASIVLLWVGFCLVGYVITAVGVTAASALRAMRQAGDDGERLGSRDVGLLPPQVRREGRERRGT